MESFEKLVFDVREDVLRGFAAGWGTGKGWSREEIAVRMIWPHNWNIQTDSTLHNIVESLIPGNDSTVLMRSDTIDGFLQALQLWEARLAVKLESRVVILSASMDFAFKFFSRDEAEVVRSIFETLPEDVEVSEDYQPQERTDTGAQGPEMYAPTHDYEFSASGTVRGDLRGVLQVSERCHQHERIKRKPVQLQLAS